MQDSGGNTRASNSLTSPNQTDPSLPPPRQAQYRGRFAPSPTGQLHLGSLIAAMASYLQSAAAGGKWHVRIDDIDPPRELAGASTDIIGSLAQHGFESDGEVRFQSNHFKRYENALSHLIGKGQVYGCSCTRKSIRQAQHAQIQSTTNNESSPPASGVSPNIYPGLCRNRNLPTSGNVLRFKATGTIEHIDKIQGLQSQDLESDVGDFIVRRRDGLYAYQLANVVDDGVDGITEIVRGADLLDNTPRQIALANALGYKVADYLHVPTATNADGQKLSKQTAAPPLKSDEAIKNLTIAWRFLGQIDMGMTLASTKNHKKESDVRLFWAIAKENWRPDKIPHVQCLPVEYFQT